MFSKISVKKPFTVIVGIIIVIILGVISYTNTGVDLLPSMNLPYIVVATILPGASPEEVEKTLTNPVEAGLSSVANISSLQSTSSEHFSMVILEFTSETNVDTAYNDVKAALDMVEFPDNDLLQEPIILKINPSLLPIMQFSISRDGYSIKDSSDYLSGIVEKVKGVSGVASANPSGLISNLAYVDMKAEKIAGAFLDYVEETFGIELVLSDEVKETLRVRLRDIVDEDITAEELLDEIIDVLTENRFNESEGTDEERFSSAIVSLIMNLVVDGIRSGEEGNYTYNEDALEAAQSIIDSRVILADGEGAKLFNNLIDQFFRQMVENYIYLQLGPVSRVLTPDILKQLIYAQDFDMPSGTVDSGSFSYIVKIGTTIKSRAELLDLPVVSFNLGAEITERVEIIEDILSLFAIASGGKVTFTENQLQQLADALYDIYGDEEAPPAPEYGITSERAEAVVASLALILPESVTDELPEDWEEGFADYVEENAPSKWNRAFTVNVLSDSIDMLVDYLDEENITLSAGAISDLQDLQDDVTVTEINENLAFAYASMVTEFLPGPVRYRLPVGWEARLAEIYQENVPVDWMLPAYSPTNDLIKQLMIIFVENMPAEWIPDLPADWEMQMRNAADETVLPTLADRLEDLISNLDPEAQDMLEDLFRDRSRADVENTLRTALRVLNYISPNGMLIPEKVNGSIPLDAIYTVDFLMIKEDLRGHSEKTIIPLTLSSLSDIFFFDDATKQFTTLMVNKGGVWTQGSAVTISIEKEPDKSTTQITGDIIALLESIKKEDPSFSYTILANDGDFIDLMMGNVVNDLIYGGILAAVVIFMFLRNIKATLVVSASIVISVVTTFVLMYFSGITLNIVSMGGLVLAVGMLVDNSIVVIDNIYRLKAKGKNIYAAAIQGAKQMMGAIIASTLTTVIVFLPIVFIQGLTKEIFTDLALTVTFSLLASTLVAFTLIPMASSTFMKKPAKPDTKIFLVIKKGYIRALNFFLNHKVIPFVLIVVLFAAAVGGAFLMEFEMFPEMDMASFSLTSSINRTALDRYNNNRGEDDPYLTYEDVQNIIIEEMLAETQKYDAIDSVGISISQGLQAAGFSLSADGVTATVVLKPEKERDIGSLKLMRKIEDAFDSYERTKGLYTIEAGSSDMMSMFLVDNQTIKLYSHDLDQMKREAQNIRQLFMKKDAFGNPLKDEIGNPIYLDGIEKVSLSNDSVNEEYRIRINKKKANQYGLTVAQVYLQVAAALSGSNVAHTLTLADTGRNEDYDVYIYDAYYSVETWYDGVDASGNSAPIYIKNNRAVENSGVNEYYVRNNFGRDIYAKIQTGETWKSYFVARGGNIPLGTENGKFFFTELQAQNDGTVNEVRREYTATSNAIYENTERTQPFDIVTFEVSSEDMLESGAPIVKVPLYQLLEDECFIRDEDGNILYRQDTLTTELIPVGLVTTSGFDSINHQNRIRTETITIVASPGASAKDLEKLIDSTMANYNLPAGLEIEVGTSNPYIEQVFNSLYLVLALAIVLVYLVMVAQFQSLKSPLIVMVTIPMAFTGCVISLLLSGLNISIMALMGLIVLVGVVVNNGIVFIDYVNQLVEAGVPRRLALLRTGMDRLRPILMTSLTTIFALVITAADLSEAGAMLRPLAVVTVGGMVYSTILTLFIVPIIYDAVNKRIKQSQRSIALMDKNIDQIETTEMEDVLAEMKESDFDEILKPKTPQQREESAERPIKKQRKEKIGLKNRKLRYQKFLEKANGESDGEE